MECSHYDFISTATKIKKELEQEAEKSHIQVEEQSDLVQIKANPEEVQTIGIQNLHNSLCVLPARLSAESKHLSTGKEET